MIKANDLIGLGFPPHAALARHAAKHLNMAVHSKEDRAALLARFAGCAAHPAAVIDDPLLGPVARLMIEANRRLAVSASAHSAPCAFWGDPAPNTLRRMRAACKLSVTERGALLPNAFGDDPLPVGAALAVRNAVIPRALGNDIACRVHMSILDMPLPTLVSLHDTFISALEEETLFGQDARFEKPHRREHAVMDDAWSLGPATAKAKDLAWSQLGTSGDGGHFVEFGELHLGTPSLGLEKGVYLALLSHSGSRSTGEHVTTHYSRLAASCCPDPRVRGKQLAWLDADSGEGREFWAAMELMERYSLANHEVIHTRVLRHLGAQAVAILDAVHNMASREEYDSKPLIVHRRGVTSSALGTLAVLPGSMGTPGFVVRGKNRTDALRSCAHAAGRAMSRTKIAHTLCRQDLMFFLEQHGVELLSGSLCEAPMACKDIHKVMAAQAGLVEIVGRFEPRMVKMAPGERNRNDCTQTATAAGFDKTKTV